MFDAIIVGAGFAGSVLARQLAEQKGKKVLVVERRRHIAGNCFDYKDKSGVFVHAYGPHLFHTSNKEVYNYLERFTVWQEYQHKVLALVDGREIPLPFNLNSLEILFPQDMAIALEKKLVSTFGFGVKVPIYTLKEADDNDLKKLADYIYKKIFINYTIKQWGCSPGDIDKDVLKRVPVYVSRDDRYFQDTYQAVPQQGYTQLFDNLLDHRNIHLLLNTNYRDIAHLDIGSGRLELFAKEYTGDFIFTGMIDDLFDFRFGSLPYRTLDFRLQTLDKEYYQKASVVNFPNNYDFTRITEFKHIHDQKLKSTTILREYPRDFLGVEKEEDTPSYPVFKDENTALYNKYLDFSQQFPQITLVGRLAEYRYYDMDDMVARALQLYRNKFA